MNVLKYVLGIFKKRKLVHQETVLLNGVVTDYKPNLAFHFQSKATLFLNDELVATGMVDLIEKEENTVTLENMKLLKNFDLKNTNQLRVQLDSIIYHPITQNIVHDVYITLEDVSFADNSKIVFMEDKAKTMILSREMRRPSKKKFSFLKLPVILR